jgi:hypothetical protein
MGKNDELQARRCMRDLLEQEEDMALLIQVCGDRRWLAAALEEGADVNKSNAAGHTFFYFLLINMSSQADLDLFLELLPRIDLEKHRTTVRQTGFIECSAYHQLSRCSPFYLDAVMHVMEEDMPLVMQQMRYLHSRPQFRAIHDKATEMGWMPGKLKGAKPPVEDFRSITPAMVPFQAYPTSTCVSFCFLSRGDPCAQVALVCRRQSRVTRSPP